ncbi:hypothetical protein M408DRAFT_28160 [Serendipita vermifera MAFF 305830]|uniref:Manganese lipoxygenase n=1 Tax=Serendipita vermifera MAFF 305830 TaxID=933852 RepID=A0A0C2X0Y9_SERVB|nr:hypothetical protein M408DRAFT_28160 [Serendipita vermifera MAFF 305830]
MSHSVLKALFGATPHTVSPKLREWDKGIVGAELIKQGIFPRKHSPDVDGLINALIHPESSKSHHLTTGTIQGTKMAMTEVHSRITDRFRSFFDIANFESSVPQKIEFSVKKLLYTFQEPGSDKFSPHLNMVPLFDRVPLISIFDAMRLADTASVIFRIIPESFVEWAHGDPIRDSIAGIEQRNRELRISGTDTYNEPNIGERTDWYSDKVFAQQQFTGPNPTTIARASQDWVSQFSRAAQVQRNDRVVQILIEGLTDGSLFIQDYSYFRKAWNAAPDEVMSSDNGERFACASVTLFRLSKEGVLHPLAIVLDYKGSMDNSVVVFNRRLLPTDSTWSEASDWPWRYAKTCAQVSDWMRHEITVHLVHTHFVEEVVIVATQRCIPTEHIVFRLLEPHWLKTLSLNAVGRSTLVPFVIAKLAGVKDDQLYAFMRHAYATFDWEKQYVPRDLEARGFPLDELTSGNKKFHNYVYGRNMILMWRVLRNFVASVLATTYTSDAQVAQDEAIREWCTEMRSQSGGQMSTFPIITTIESLVDTVTMCIHIASPQHTAVNYLQDYYQAFVIHKPPCLFSPLPTSLNTLNTYKEKDLLAALPLKNPVEWLLASHVPHLLSYRVAEDQNLVNYAASIARLAQQGADNGEPGEAEIASAATRLLQHLIELIQVFKKNSDEMDDQTVPYNVMSPEVTAVSILI